MAIKRVGIIGAGTMGAGIAQVCATAGYDVTLADVSVDFVNKGFDRIAKTLDKSVEKGKLDAKGRIEILSRISKSADYNGLKDADLVCEAVIEDIGVKKEVFRKLDSVCGRDAIFCTNTSSMSVTEIAAASGRPAKFCGMHFFNPAHIMKLVEVIGCALTVDETSETVIEFARSLGKTPVHVKKDSPGFIVNRLLLPWMNEAAKMLAEGVATPEDIDTAVKLGLNYPMGPFEMLDMGGMDLTVTILDYYAREFGDNMYSPNLILKQMLRAGKLGRKSGEGFYKY